MGEGRVCKYYSTEVQSRVATTGLVQMLSKITYQRRAILPAPLAEATFAVLLGLDGKRWLA
ncbi:MAG TPA: hypothetical protein DDZ80_01070 [Cyanobacteria bacterium UBA8803]|nr:hypothetical protein [Cyanobacteria bacterium UBA9273]HBL57198.1 hypothetical protein [Cyanobacteria bacterium UBA8803]